MKFYLDDYGEGQFIVIHCWKILRDELKWHAVLENLDKSNKRKLDDAGDMRDITAAPEAVGGKERPIGMKEAKKQRNGKGKAKADDACLNEDMKKYMDIQATAK
uniref:Uncharacterized protein n=1 Tax=Arundo donax TaxID=35708 RepID=A0A0A9HBC7_ARUDO